ANGNVQVRWGIPEYPGDLLWESGFAGTNGEQSYYTKFEANSNLVTWQITSDKSFSQAWELGVSHPTISPYFLVVDCSERSNRVAIYQGHPTNDEAAAIVWAADPPEGSESVPFSRPTIPPTLSPSSRPSSQAVEIDLNQPMGTISPSATSGACTVPRFLALVFIVLGLFF
ncbi:MAG: hypothetical protein SGILL_000641, partial [Bacillariaceae sp.]